MRTRLALCVLALCTLAANEPTPSPPKLRLPAGVRPTHYALDLRVVPSEPAFKVPWKLTFHVRKAHVALANAAVASEIDEPNGMKAVTLEESKPLPSYLVAFVVGPFELVDGGHAGRINTPIRFIVPRGRAA